MRRASERRQRRARAAAWAAFVVGAALSAAAQDAPWQAPHWPVVPSSTDAVKRPAPIRNLVRTPDGTLVGTRPAGSSIEVWESRNQGVDWQLRPPLAASTSVVYGDSTLVVLAGGEWLAAYREQHPQLGWSIRTSRSVDGGQTWTYAGAVHEWTMSPDVFVGAPHWHVLDDGTLQAYYDTEAAAAGGGQFVGLKHGAWDERRQQWTWHDERIVNRQGSGDGLVRDGMAAVVSLGPDDEGRGERLLVVAEGVGVERGLAYNLVRAFVVGNGGAAQSDWDQPLASGVLYRSPYVDAQGRRFNAYAPYAVGLADGAVLVAFSTDEPRHAAGLPADDPSASPEQRHSAVRLLHSLDGAQSWSTATPVWEPGSPAFAGDLESEDWHNYQIGLLELAPDDLLATLDFFGGRQVVFRPALGGPSADLDRDGAVGGADLLLWQRQAGLTGQFVAGGDLTGEGAVDHADAAVWGRQFGQPYAAGIAALPEPTGLGLWALAAAGLRPSGRLRRPVLRED